MLLAFLLTVRFSSRFREVDRTGKIVFVVSLVCSATATVLFLAPAAYHRFSEHCDRGPRLRFGVRTAVIGLLLLGAAVALAVFVVVHFLFTDVLAAALGGSIAALALLVWVVVPVVQRSRSHSASRRDHV